MYAHVANGGIRIDTHARTNVPGLFVCGQVTGGIHGADRIEGLSSANGLVFGQIASKGAAHHGTATSACINADGIKESLERIRMNAAPLDDIDASRITKDIQVTMSAHVMIQRSEKGHATALDDMSGCSAKHNITEIAWLRDSRRCRTRAWDTRLLAAQARPGDAAGNEKPYRGPRIALSRRLSAAETIRVRFGEGFDSPGAADDFLDNPTPRSPARAGARRA